LSINGLPVICKAVTVNKAVTIFSLGIIEKIICNLIAIGASARIIFSGSYSYSTPLDQLGVLCCYLIRNQPEEELWPNVNHNDPHKQPEHKTY
jgi:hypothetical protein